MVKIEYKLKNILRITFLEKMEMVKKNIYIYPWRRMEKSIKWYCGRFTIYQFFFSHLIRVVSETVRQRPLMVPNKTSLHIIINNQFFSLENSIIMNSNTKRGSIIWNHPLYVYIFKKKKHPQYLILLIVVFPNWISIIITPNRRNENPAVDIGPNVDFIFLFHIGLSHLGNINRGCFI